MASGAGMTRLIDWAIRYIEKFNFALVPLHGKAPYVEGWNLEENLIRTPERAKSHLRPGDNFGAYLGPSGIVSLDADHDATKAVLAAERIDLDVLIAHTPTIIGRAPRLEFAAPPGLGLEKKVIKWPKPEDPTGPGRMTILELRAGANQDVLPPSIHPGTSAPYRWMTAPRHGFPPLPDEILALWLNFEAFQQRARKVCPWAKPERMQAPRTQSRPCSGGPSIIQAFNDAHSVVSMLEAHGYQRAGKRWKSPHGKPSSAPGLVVLPSGKVFCHHSDDPLGDERSHDAFDLYALFDHGGDVRAAVRAAAKVLGMDQGGAHGR
jgi:putative DNA primase/helicase